MSGIAAAPDPVVALPLWRRLPSWLLVLLAWTAFGLIWYAQVLVFRVSEGRAIPPGRAFEFTLFVMGPSWAMALATPLIVKLARAVPLSAWYYSGVVTHLFAVLLLKVPLSVLDRLLGANLGGPGLPPLMMYANGMALTVGMYATVLAITYAIDQATIARRNAVERSEIAAELARTQLLQLRTQLQPHFLFNTLNTIAALLKSDPDLSERMIAQLGDLLRRSIEERHSLLSRLDDELELLELYTGIEEIRFKGWIEIVVDVDDDVRDAVIPAMLLQPLVENALRHGIAAAGRKGTVWIRATRDGGELVVEVADDGVGLPPDDRRRSGLGLEATEQRLARSYGDQYRFELRPRQPHGTIAMVRLPYREAAPWSDALA